MKYLQADNKFRKSNKNSLTSNEAKVDRQAIMIPGRAHYNNYYANSTADLNRQKSPITGAVIGTPAKNSNKTWLLCI